MILISLLPSPPGSMKLSRKVGLVLGCLILANTCGWAQNPTAEPQTSAEPVRSSITVVGNIETEAPAFVSTMNRDRKSTRLNSSHQIISYSVFCLTNNYVETPSRTLTARLVLACPNHYIPAVVVRQTHASTAELHDTVTAIWQSAGSLNRMATPRL